MAPKSRKPRNSPQSQFDTTEWKELVKPPLPTLRPLMKSILRITVETPTIKSFAFKAPSIAQVARPGQFLMVWVPGIDEIPMSVSLVNSKQGEIEFAVRRVGDATSALHQKKKGALIGLRGPLGHGYCYPDSSKWGPILIVAGGCGAAPLLFAANHAKNLGFEVHVVLGGSTKTELLYRSRFEELAQNIILTTDDGTIGIEGLAVDGAHQLLRSRRESNKPKYSVCFACGPEAMLFNLSHIMRKYQIPLQISLERYMKCGVGLCGHCIIDLYGTRVCQEGPVFYPEALENTDFGSTERDATGRQKTI